MMTEQPVARPVDADKDRLSAEQVQATLDLLQSWNDDDLA
jgi:hypothetical protein